MKSIYQLKLEESKQTHADGNRTKIRLAIVGVIFKLKMNIWTTQYRLREPSCLKTSLKRDYFKLDF